MNDKEAVVFSAGKTARGFIAHLLTLSGYHITFVEKNPELVDALRKQGKYKVNVFGAPEKSLVIRDFVVLQSEERERVREAVANASVIFISVGGQNLPHVAPLLAEALEGRAEPINIILAENYFEAGKILRTNLLEHIDPAKREWLNKSVGIVEAAIMRTSTDFSEETTDSEPLTLFVQNMWEMPTDKSAFVGEIPPIQGLAPKDNFQNGLVQKVFTYNAINAVITYLGNLKGYKLLRDAAHDEEILAVARAAASEANEALIKRYGFDRKEQQAMADSSIAKYQMKEIVDPVERNGRDPLRKLSRNDRLVGPACLALEYGIRPEAFSQAIAAGYHYVSPGDPASLIIQKLIREVGIREAVSRVSGIESNSPLTDMVCDWYKKQSRD
jgi:mannitol-1-phosphate 5-dehydrogenase